ncbi:MAG: WbqC-like protein [Parcubacteria group bacterium GW2011_GWC2_44_22]|nr:MAG: WbqC-like protein [Parcubacteria group bacterium GW2011_GWC2_44_22]
MQPNYLPWAGYFNLIDNCDVFVFLDHVQYTKNEWINRNRIKIPKDWIYLTVPIKTSGKLCQPIMETEIDNNANWQKKHWRSIQFNYAKAPYYDEFSSVLQEIYQKKWVYISDLNITSTKIIMDNLGLKKEISFSSKMNVAGHKTDLVINICKQLKATEYISPLGANAYIEEDKFKQNNIKLIYQTYLNHHPIYPQLWGKFVSHLSIIDLIFNCGKNARQFIKYDQ